MGSDSLAEGFKNVRSRVDNATSKWVGLPTGTDAATGQDAANAMATEFGAAASGGSATAAAEIATDSYDSIILSPETASANLNQTINSQESAIRKMTVDASTYISSQSEQENFNLDAYSLKDFESDEMISLDRSEADTVTFNMERLISAMDSAKTAMTAIPSDSFLLRNANVGLGSTGPYTEIKNLQGLLSQCLISPRNEYERGRDLFQAAADDFFATDGEAEAIARALSNELEEEVLGS